ncbi:MAG: SDR family oxidoreductase [Acidobacteriia bacterium]|nr:SDR family oxidoreductase [Terriglobia bacterium]
MSGLRVLITGGTGLLGHALLQGAPQSCETLATAFRSAPAVEWRARFRPLDVRDARAVDALIADYRPGVVIHAASVGSVDQAEREPDAVRRTNVDGLAAVGRACARAGARLVFISSNAVFDGTHPPYDEQAPRHAVNQYGRLKIEAEEWLEASGLPHAIVRPILMYGWPPAGGRSNVVTRWLADFEAGRPAEVAQDIRSMPLLASNCADAIWAVVRLDRRGIYHVAGADRVTLVEFARETARVFGCSEDLVVPVPSARFTSLAPRPADTSFVLTKMERDLGVRPLGVHEGLVAMRLARALAR